MHKKRKGDIAELAVAKHLMKEGWEVLFPFGDRLRYDLVVEKSGQFLRIQVKYVTPKNGSLAVRCRSSNNWSVKKYTASEIDYISVFDSRSEKIYFVAATEMNDATVTLRVDPARNKQKMGINFASNFQVIRPKTRLLIPPLDKIPQVR